MPLQVIQLLGRVMRLEADTVNLDDVPEVQLGERLDDARMGELDAVHDATSSMHAA